MSSNAHLHFLPLAELTGENIRKSGEPEAMRWQKPGKAYGGNLIGHVKGPLLMAYSFLGMPLLWWHGAMWGMCWRGPFPPVSQSAGGEDRRGAARQPRCSCSAACRSFMQGATLSHSADYNFFWRDAHLWFLLTPTDIDSLMQLIPDIVRDAPIHDFAESVSCTSSDVFYKRGGTSQLGRKALVDPQTPIWPKQIRMYWIVRDAESS